MLALAVVGCAGMEPTGGAAPSRGGAVSSEAALVPVRMAIGPDQAPPEGLGAFGLVAFTSVPNAADRERSLRVCEAYRSALIPNDALPEDLPLGRRMVTFWPVTDMDVARGADYGCDHLVGRYNLHASLSAIRDADRHDEGLAERRGPILIGWAPAASRYDEDAVVLVIDLSPLESQDSFNEAFRYWRSQIVDRPELWESGFSMARLRLALRDFLDKYGASLLKVMS